MIVTASTFRMNSDTYNKLSKLFREFCSCKGLSAVEFVEAKLCSDETSLTEDEISKLVLIVDHKDFLNAVKDNFVRHYNLRNYNEIRIIMVIFTILFGCDQTNAQELCEVFKNSKCAFKCKLLEYFCSEKNLMQTALTGCQFFEDEYIVNHIIRPFLDRTEIFKEVERLLFLDKAKQRKVKPPTIPDNLNVLQKRRRTPTVPLNTPVEETTFRANGIPKSLYELDNVSKKLAGKYEENRRRAQKLLTQAKEFDRNYCKLKKPILKEEIPKFEFKANKAPSALNSNVEIKSTIATTLREASLCIKEQEKEIKNIEDIMKGGAAMYKYKELEESVRKLQQQKSTEDIERKHLEGMLTFEEAILAKRKLIECNKIRFKRFMEERETSLRRIAEWREREQERLKLLVKQGQEVEKNAKESERRLKIEKKNQVDQMKDETRKMLQEAYEKQQEELAKRAKLIEEIKALHQLKSLEAAKEFDASEGPNLGLLCEMSIADLQEELSEIKVKMAQELEQKRKCIRMSKAKHKKMIENVRHFITQSRMSKPKKTAVPTRPAKLTHSPELDRLRGQLEQAREQRRHYLWRDDIPLPSVYKYMPYNV